MTDPAGVPLDREQLERALTALGDRLVRRGVVADVFIVGGAAIGAMSRTWARYVTSQRGGETSPTGWRHTRWARTAGLPGFVGGCR